MYIIAGLGNPGKKYEKTGHNAGFDVIDELAEQYNISIDEKKQNALCGKGIIAGQKVVLVKPQTFMNLSGDSIAGFLNYYKMNAASQLVVVFDDISLAPGRIRIRKKGSAGGHNGIKNIIARIGTQEFARVKIGVGEKPSGWDLADHVLGKMDRTDREAMESVFQDAVHAVELIVQGKIEQAMNDYNAKK